MKLRIMPIKIRNVNYPHSTKGSNKPSKQSLSTDYQSTLPKFQINHTYGLADSDT